MRRLILLMLLLLVLPAALAGCAEPGPQVVIVRSTVEAPQTVIATRVLTAAPLATQTPYPTQKPLPTHTPIPTVKSPSQVEIDHYGLRITEINEITLDAMTMLTERLKEPDRDSADWRADIAEVAQDIRSAREELLALEPPPELVEIHEQYLGGYDDWVSSMDYLEAYLDDGDRDDLDRHQALLISGFYEVNSAAERLDALASP